MGEPHEKFWILCFFQPHSRKSVHPRYQCDQNRLEYVSFPETPLPYNFCSIFLFLEHLLKQNLWFLEKKSQRCGNRRSCIDDVLCNCWNFTNTPNISKRYKYSGKMLISKLETKNPTCVKRSIEKLDNIFALVLKICARRQKHEQTGKSLF